MPVTAKIRLGCTRDTINAIDVAQAVEAAGGAAVTVHGRTAEDCIRAGPIGTEIARIKPHLQAHSAGRQRRSDHAGGGRRGLRPLRRGRRDDRPGGLGRPWLFRQAAAALAGEPIPPDPTPDQQRTLLLDHYRRIVERFGPIKGTILMRRYACCYARGCPGAREFRQHIARVSTPEEFFALVERHFPRS